MDAGRLRRETRAIAAESNSFTATPIFKINSTPVPLIRMTLYVIVTYNIHKISSRFNACYTMLASAISAAQIRHERPFP